MSEISFGNIILAASGKKGVLKPNDKGIYRLNSGGFNIPNHAGIKYGMNDYLIEQMDENSDLNRRIKMGYCKMEVEHPEPYVYVEENGIRYRREMTDLMEWIARLRSYDTTQICGLISKIYFLPEDEKNMMAPIYTEIDCEPFGLRGPEFKESLGNPRHNTAVSIRTEVAPFKRGDTNKSVRYWTGFDWVSEPGMIHANKHMSAGCESMLSDYRLSVDNVQKFKVSDVLERMGGCLAAAANDPEALARVGGLESLKGMNDMYERLKNDYRIGDTTNVGVGFTSIF